MPFVSETAKSPILLMFNIKHAKGLFSNLLYLFIFATSSVNKRRIKVQYFGMGRLGRGHPGLPLSRISAYASRKKLLTQNFIHRSTAVQF